MNWRPCWVIARPALDADPASPGRLAGDGFHERPERFRSATTTSRGLIRKLELETYLRRTRRWSWSDS